MARAVLAYAMNRMSGEITDMRGPLPALAAWESLDQVVASARTRRRPRTQ